MKHDARKLSTEEKAQLRKKAVERVLNGESIKQVTEYYGLGEKTIFKWLRKARESGIEALAPVPRSGRKRLLRKEDETVLRRWLLFHPPSYFGFDEALWNSILVKQLIHERFHVELSVSSVHRLLHRLTLAPKREKAVKSRDGVVLSDDWKDQGFAGINKLARRENAKVLWLAEKQVQGVDLGGVAFASYNRPMCFYSVTSGSGAFRYSGVSHKGEAVDVDKFIKSFTKDLDGSLILILMPNIDVSVSSLSATSKRDACGIVRFIRTQYEEVEAAREILYSA